MAANPEQGEVDIDIAGQTYTLKLSMKAACQIQQRAKKTIGELMLAAERLDYEAIRFLMWAVLQHHHGKDYTTVDSVERLLDAGGGPKPFFAYARKLSELEEAERMEGEAKRAAENPQGAQADGTGESSRSLATASA